MFDINDFDETLPASWEFDLNRLVTTRTADTTTSASSAT